MLFLVSNQYKKFEKSSPNLNKLFKKLKNTKKKNLNLFFKRHQVFNQDILTSYN